MDPDEFEPVEGHTSPDIDIHNSSRNMETKNDNELTDESATLEHHDSQLKDGEDLNFDEHSYSSEEPSAMPEYKSQGRRVTFSDITEVVDDSIKNICYEDNADDEPSEHEDQSASDGQFESRDSDADTPEHRIIRENLIDNSNDGRKLSTEPENEHNQSQQLSWQNSFNEAEDADDSNTFTSDSAEGLQNVKDENAIINTESCDENADIERDNPVQHSAENALEESELSCKSVEQQFIEENLDKREHVRQSLKLDLEVCEIIDTDLPLTKNEEDDEYNFGNANQEASGVTNEEENAEYVQMRSHDSDSSSNRQSLEKIKVVPLPQTPFTPWFSPPPSFEYSLPYLTSSNPASIIKNRLESFYHTRGGNAMSQRKRHHSDSCTYSTSSNNIGPIDLWGEASVQLRLSEMSHICHVISKAYLDDFFCAADERLYKMLCDGKICFYCRLTRFTFFGKRGRKCSLCQRLICENCLIKVRIPQEYLNRIPVYALCPENSEIYKTTSSVMTKVHKLYRNSSLPHLSGLPLPHGLDCHMSSISIKTLCADLLKLSQAQIQQQLRVIQKLLQNKHQDRKESGHLQDILSTEGSHGLFTRHGSDPKIQNGNLDKHHEQGSTRAKILKHKKHLNLVHQHQSTAAQLDDQLRMHLMDLVSTPYVPSLHDLRSADGAERMGEGNERATVKDEVCFGCEEIIVNIVKFNRWRPMMSLIL